MDYSKICKVYEELENTTRGLEKTSIISKFLGEIKNNPQFIYLLQGRIFPDYDNSETGISAQLAIKTISKASGVSGSEAVNKFKELGDLGLVAEEIIKNNKSQTALFTKKLSTSKVLENLKKLPTIEGHGAVDKKIGYIVELLHSATPKEAKYIIRTILNDLRIGVGSGILRDAIGDYCFHPKDTEDKKICASAIQEAYDKSTDFAKVFEYAMKDSLEKIKLEPGRPIKVMLYPKAKNVEDAFRIVGRPAAFEYKYDGFRVMINKTNEGEIKIFTRRLEEVTRQFPEIVEYAKENISAKSFIVDGEAVGFEAKTKKYTNFQAISQRIKRKYEISQARKTLPIELTIFDIIYYNDDSLIEKEFQERRKILETIVRQEPYKIILSKQIVTENTEEVEKFYSKALEENQEGLMGKSLTAPYKPGARVGYSVKLKPEDNDFDLVITGAEWGTGKRTGWLTSFDVACIDDGKLLEIGKVSTGLKELDEQGLSFRQMTDMLENLVIENKGTKVRVKPEIVVTVQYQNIQKSPTYSSGYALRFPRITRLREDRGTTDIASLEEVKKEAG